MRKVKAKLTPQARALMEEAKPLYLPELQRASDLMEKCRASIWCDDDAGTSGDFADEAIDILVKLGVLRRERDYNNEANPSGVPDDA